MRPRIGITLGDCAGIGPEIVDAALKSGRLPESAEYVVIGRQPNCKPGAPSIETARAAAAGLEEAVTRARRGELHAIVTGPIHKARMYEAGFKFPGQTEFFAERCGVKNFAMCLTGGKLTVALVTSHIPLARVPGALKQSEIVRVGLLLAEFLEQRNATPNLNAKSIQVAYEPKEKVNALSIQVRIAVCGLNPHAGESGKIGREEIDLIEPAVQELNSSLVTRHASLAFSGPHSPDTIFRRAVEGEFNAVLCMYHDQGLIPLKLHAFHSGVNTTLGLPFPRTSPDHGTAFEIAGKAIAKPDSVIAAITLAAELAAKK
ncbi:MAG TPA: 4-hydroxythreonine-4-phosphate dehydrogenase PdxA [Chthoniobacterales bacterium]|nr:4-hydroxythreonine-4-phosphate dehydrogenase PdxA [Chthoniobacterales bacterium]